jgi:ribulose-phosphate 3-epimerase
MTSKTIIAPSILSADQTRLADAIHAVAKAGCKLVHVDVMDGHFVDNITIGPGVVADIVKTSREVGIGVDVHLMIDNPIRHLQKFIDAGPEYLSIHQEATVHHHKALSMIKDAGIKAGIAINPSTTLITLEEVIQMMDLLIIMTVNPGWGGQKYIEMMEDKIQLAREFADAENPECKIMVDGGVDSKNAKTLSKMGVDILVAGNSVFKGKGSIEENIKALLG